jgi:hypothetical protein
MVLPSQNELQNLRPYQSKEKQKKAQMALNATFNDKVIRST